jgi:hypothetical protein
VDNENEETLEVDASTLLFRGTVSPAKSTVTAGTPARPIQVQADADGRWHVRVPLKAGHNSINVSAFPDDPNFRPSRIDTYQVSRALTEEEEAAKEAREKREAERLREELERDRQEQEAARAQQRADFIASAAAIDYGQVLKEPDAHRGDRVTVSGEILQIKQSGDQGFMLVWSSCDEFDICDDPVYVRYDGVRVQGAEGDKITVYGTVTGALEYDTQMGGTNYVPKVRARYVDE